MVQKYGNDEAISAFAWPSPSIQGAAWSAPVQAYLGSFSWVNSTTRHPPTTSCARWHAGSAEHRAWVGQIARALQRTRIASTTGLMRQIVSLA
jgi:hypothetical protein